MLEILWVKAGYKKIRSVRTGKERAKKMVGVKTFDTTTYLSHNQVWTILSWLVLCRIAKTSLFSPFMETEKNFLLKPQDCYFVTIIKCPEKRCKLATFTNKKRKFNKTPRKCLNFRIRCISLFAKWGLVNLQEYIDFFNRKRPHRKLKLQTPDQFEENYMAGLASNC